MSHLMKSTLNSLSKSTDKGKTDDKYDFFTSLHDIKDTRNFRERLPPSVVLDIKKGKCAEVLKYLKGAGEGPPGFEPAEITTTVNQAHRRGSRSLDFTTREKNTDNNKRARSGLEDASQEEKGAWAKQELGSDSESLDQADDDDHIWDKPNPAVGTCRSSGFNSRVVNRTEATTGDTVLHIAIAYQKKPLYTRLIKCSCCNVEIRNARGQTPLHIAIISKNLHALKKLLALRPPRQVNVLTPDKEGNTALHHAAARNLPTSAFRKLLRSCPSPVGLIGLRNAAGRTALELGALHGASETVRLILSLCPTSLHHIDDLHEAPSTNSEAVRPGAESNGSFRANRRSTSTGSPAKTTAETVLDAALRSNQSGLVVSILKYMPAESVPADFIRRLVVSGLTDLLVSLFRLAVDHNEPALLASANSSKNSSACAAVKFHGERIPSDVAAALVKATQNFNEQDGEGRTLVHLALEKGRTSVLNVLLSHPAIDFTLTDNGGRNALHACFDKDLYKVDSSNALIRWLVERHEISLGKRALPPTRIQPGVFSQPFNRRVPHMHVSVWAVTKAAFINKQDSFGRSPLHAILISPAAPIDKLRFVRALISLEADVTLRDKWGNTPLHHAVNSGNVLIARAVAQGNREALNIANEEGDTPLKIALERQQTELINAIKNE